MDKSKDKILVTGATGRQGGAVARYLLKGGYKVVVIGEGADEVFAGYGRHLANDLAERWSSVPGALRA